MEARIYAVIAMLGVGTLASLGAAQPQIDAEGEAAGTARISGLFESPVVLAVAANAKASINPSDEDQPLAANASIHFGRTREGPEPFVPCSDPSGCPDLIVDANDMRDMRVHTITFDETDCSVIEGHTQPGTRRLLRFTFTTPNVGAGDLVVGAVADHPEWFEYSSCHGHYHFHEYADYRLWTLDGYTTWQALRAIDPSASAQQVMDNHPEVLGGLVDGHKQGFCVIDVVAYVPPIPPGVNPPPSLRPRYTDCLWNQGIKVGWADRYSWALDGQWVDITGLPAGPYVLEAEVNAERFYEESDYRNNAAAVLVVVQ